MSTLSFQTPKYPQVGVKNGGRIAEKLFRKKDQKKEKKKYADFIIHDDYLTYSLTRCLYDNGYKVKNCDFTIYSSPFSEYYDDEKINLNKILDGNIICIANLGLWNGKKSGYKILSDNLNNIFDVCEDYNEFFIDNYDVKAKCTHHDGTNYYTFREIKQDVNIDILTDKIYNGNFTQKDITRYTKSLKPYLKKIYGW